MLIVVGVILHFYPKGSGSENEKGRSSKKMRCFTSVTEDVNFKTAIMLSQVDSAEMNTDDNINREDVVHDKNKNVEEKENEHRNEDSGSKKDENEQENIKTSDSGCGNEKERASKKTRCDQKTQKDGNGKEDVQMNTVNNGKELRKGKNDNKTSNLHQVLERICSGEKQVFKGQKEKEKDSSRTQESEVEIVTFILNE